MDGTDGIAIEGTVQIEGADTDMAVIMLSESNHRRAESQGWEQQIIHLWPGSPYKDTRGSRQRLCQQGWLPVSTTG